MTPVFVRHFDKSSRLPYWVESEFDGSADGQLLHLVDGKLRATIPPEGWDDYVKTWPEALPVVEQLRTGPRQAAQDLQEAVQAMLAATQADLKVGTEIILPAADDPAPAAE